MTKDSLAQRLRDAADLIPTEDVLAFLTAIIEARREELRSREEMERVAAARQVALAQIRSKHALYRLVFDRIFDERREAIAKHFAIIDRSVATGDARLLLGALNGLGEIVAASPFTDLKRLAATLENDVPIEI